MGLPMQTRALPNKYSKHFVLAVYFGTGGLIAIAATINTHPITCTTNGFHALRQYIIRNMSMTKGTNKHPNPHRMCWRNAVTKNQMVPPRMVSPPTAKRMRLRICMIAEIVRGFGAVKPFQ